MEDPTASAEDIVVYVITEDNKILSWGRGTFLEAERFVAQPKYPAQSTDRFIAVDDWGHGKCVASYDENLLGLSWREVQSAFARVRGEVRS